MTLLWLREPVIIGRDTGYADYALRVDGRPTEIGIRWVRHPTATYKYMLLWRGEFVEKYRSVAEAKAAGRELWDEVGP